MTAFQIALDNAFDQHFGPLQQPNPILLTPLTKKKRNQKTRDHHKKKKAQAQAQRVTIQEIEHSDVQISVEKASKHMVLQLWD